MATHGLDPSAATLVRSFRERRVAEGLSCPRCQSNHVVRWGQSSGRQRYRCRSCSRCFSDLTDTPLTYLKRLDAWPAYFRCLNRSMTVRAAAEFADVSVGTAFRWRHFILAASDQSDATLLRGTVEFAVASLSYSEKGYRAGIAPEWTPRMYYDWLPWFALPGCKVIVARDRHGAQRVEFVDTGTLTGAQLRALFDDVLAEDALLLCPTGRFGPFGHLRPTRSGGMRRLVRVSATSGLGLERFHNRNARTWLARFGSWLVRFHGVATRYVPNYLAWRTKLDLIESGPWLDALLPYVGGPTSPTLPDDTRGMGDGGKCGAAELPRPKRRPAAARPSARDGCQSCAPFEVSHRKLRPI